jgi:hypothetical protein
MITKEEREQSSPRFQWKRAIRTCFLVVWAAGSATPQPVEPQAGNWKTFVMSSGRHFRVPPPPGEAETRAELAWVRAASTDPDPQIEPQIRYWDAGAPAYRWIDMLVKRQNAGQPTTAFPHRVFTYVAIAMHDATIAGVGAEILL